MLKKAFFLFFPLLLAAAGINDPTAMVAATVGQPPAWVEYFEYELAPASVKPSHVNIQCLLVDTQRNWEEKTLYCREAVKPLTQAGVEDVSHLELLYDPAFYHVCVHSIRVYRNGMWHDRLSTARQHVLQREDDLEMQVYSGFLTLVYFISDIRIGDVIEYQYSYIGGNPLLTTLLDDEVHLENHESIEKYSYRLLASPARELEIKPFLTNHTLTVQDISPDLREWSISVSETKACSSEPNQPATIHPCACIQINEYHTWKAVIERLKPLVALPDSFMEDPSSEILLLLNEWASFDPHERARLATRFVQNEIHYLSLSDGIAAFKPEDPTVCFTRRFGDCKDKTLLLHGLLKQLGISSTPILVHSFRGAFLPSSLPSPLLFNHMILRIEFGNETVFVDPTITLQGGLITANYCPRYFYGLPLSDASSQLIEMPDIKLIHPIEIETTLNLSDENTIKMKVEARYYDHEAEGARRALAYQGVNRFSENHLLYIQSLYRGSTALMPLETMDDSKQNLFITREVYSIPLRTKKGKRQFKVQPQLLYDYLENDINPERTMPYVLEFPTWVQEHVHIDHLDIKDSACEEMNFDHACFLYRSSVNKLETEADLYFEINFIKDQITPRDIPAFNEIMSTIESDTDLEVTFMSLSKKGQGSHG